MTTPNIEELRLLAQTLEFSDAVRCSIQRAADLLQSQAERIKELEAEIDNIKAVEFPRRLDKVTKPIIAERDTLRAQLADAELHTKQVERGSEMTTPNEELRKLAESAKPKPIGNMASQQEKSAHMTRHMDARMALARAMEPEHVITMCDFMQSQAERIKYWQDVHAINTDTLNAMQVEIEQRDAQLAAIAATEPVAYRWVWKSKPHDIEGWCYTHTPPNHPELQEIEKLFTHPMPAQDVTELVDALKDVAQTLAWMQHGKCRGFSDGLLTTDEALDKARTALAKYKGAK